MKKILFILAAGLVIAACGNNHNTAESKNKLSSADDEAFLDTLQRRSFLYFLHEANPENGLVKDRSTAASPASIAAVGFAIPVWAVGAERGWISREEAARRTLNAARFFMNSEQSKDALATGYKGMYYHFLDLKNGKRFWSSELSTIDTGLLLAGLRFAAQYFNKDNDVENEIKALADSLTYRVDWNFMTLSEKEEHGLAMSMSWKPERGFNKTGWVGYNEALILYVIAAGSSYTDYEKAYDKWLSSYHWGGSYKGLEHVLFPPLFGHQYSHIFIDFRNLADKYLQEKGIDYFENSRRAVLTQRQYAIENPNKWEGYDSLTWGLTACDGPGSKYNKNGRSFMDYSARGVAGDLIWDDGTIAPTAAAASIPFAPEVVMPTLKNFMAKYGNKGLWDKYGFVDAFNPTADWYDKDYIGIDQGPIVLMIENYRTGMIWEYCMKDPVIQEGLKRLGFQPLTK